MLTECSTGLFTFCLYVSCHFKIDIRGVQSIYMFSNKCVIDMFSSVAETWKNCLDGATDFKEVNGQKITQV